MSDKMWLPNANPSDTRAVAKKKCGGIQAIDQGTYRDVEGMLRKQLRAIERGDHGDVRTAVLVLSTTIDGTKSNRVTVFSFGVGGLAEAHWMLSTAKNRIEPS